MWLQCTALRLTHVNKMIRCALDNCDEQPWLQLNLTIKHKSKIQYHTITEWKWRPKSILPIVVPWSTNLGNSLRYWKYWDNNPSILLLKTDTCAAICVIIGLNDNLALIECQVITYTHADFASNARYRIIFDQNSVEINKIRSRKLSRFCPL